jgi:hypothetical protein
LQVEKLLMAMMMRCILIHHDFGVVWIRLSPFPLLHL